MYTTFTAIKLGFYIPVFLKFILILLRPLNISKYSSSKLTWIFQKKCILI